MKKIVYSLNLLTWFKQHGVEIEFKHQNGFLCGVIDATEETARLLEEYKNNEELQEFLHTYKDIKMTMKELREVA